MTGLTAPHWKPWHMKANYLVFNNGVVSDTGTIEEWWIEPNRWKRTYTTKTQTATEWRGTRTRRFQTKQPFEFTTLDLRVGGPLVVPMEQTANIKPEYPMDWKQLDVGVQLKCVSVVNPQQYADEVDPDYLFPKLCFDTDSRLRLMGTSDTTVSFNKYEMFENRAVAAKVDVIVLGQKKSTMEMTVLEPLSVEDERLVDPDKGAVPQPLQLTAVDRRPVPVYQVGADRPKSAMLDRVYGTVRIPVLIQKDGRVKQHGQAIGDWRLTDSAVGAVLRWRYEPYLVDGEPVEVATILAYTFDEKPFVPQTGPKPKVVSTSGYDPKRDPEKDLAAALSDAKQAHKRVLMQVGGDWCPACLVMNKFFETHSDLEKLRDTNYVVLKVNFSFENHNTAFLMHYPRIPSFPYLFVLDADGNVLQAQQTGALEKGDSYSEDQIREFLLRWKPS